MRIAVFAALACLFPAICSAQSLSLSDILDNSVGYVNLSPGVVMIEGEEVNVICEISLGQQFFEAYRAGDLDAVRAASDVTCVPFGAFVE